MHGEVPVLLSLSSLQPSWSSEQGAPGEIQPAAWCSASHSPSARLPRCQNFMFSPLVRHRFHPGSLQQSPSWLLCVCQCPETITFFSWPARHQKNPRFGSSNAGGNHSASGSVNPSGWGQLFEKKRAAPACPAATRSLKAALQCLQASTVLEWVSKMWLVSHERIDLVRRFLHAGYDIIGQICKDVWSWGLFLAEIRWDINVYRETQGDTCGADFFFLLPS